MEIEHLELLRSNRVICTEGHTEGEPIGLLPDVGLIRGTRDGFR